MQFSIIRLFGKDPVKFVQDQATCDLNKYAICRGAFCDHKGRVIATFLAKRQSDDVLLRLLSNQVANVTQQLQMLMRFSQIEWQDITDQIPIYFSDSAADDCFEHSRENDSVFEIWSKTACSAPHLTSEQVANKLTTMGIVELDVALSQALLPHNLGLHLGTASNCAISMDKGCYRGQEIVARTHYLGRVKKQLYLLAGEGLTIGDKCFSNGQNIGTVVQVGSHNALAVLQNHNISTIATEHYQNIKIVKAF